MNKERRYPQGHWNFISRRCLKDVLEKKIQDFFFWSKKEKNVGDQKILDVFFLVKKRKEM